MKDHTFLVELSWTGNTGSGTSGYRAYSRDHEISGERKRVPIEGSSDPVFRGDAARYNPEELLIGSLSSCHMLWYLHLCADAGIVVIDYRDSAVGTVAMEPNGAGQFTDVLLRPRVTIQDGADTERATELHHRAHDFCFIARSVNFPVRCEPATRSTSSL